MNEESPGTEQRRAQLASNLAQVRDRIAAACAAAARNAADVTLIAVTKTWPASDVRLLVGLGVPEIGENRDQEARAKAAACADLAITWHFVGQLQTNKCRSVARYAAVVHSIDRLELVRALSLAAAEHERPVTALVQVRLGSRVGGAGRGGAAPGEVAALAEAVASAPGLVLGGVMAVAPLGDDPDEVYPELAAAAAAVRDSHPAATIISAGMTGDLEAAVRHGATHVRIGTALLGHRATPVG